MEATSVKVSEGIHRRLPPITVTPALCKRFWAKVDRRSDDECWPWLASLRNGYGAFKIGKPVYSCHRVAYVLTNGEPAEGLVVGHKCDNRMCCNPAHLEAISITQNNRDSLARVAAFRPRGEACSQSVLTDSVVKQIRSMHIPGRFSYRRIAKQLGLNEHTVKHVIDGKGWAHIESLEYGDGYCAATQDRKTTRGAAS